MHEDNHDVCKECGDACAALIEALKAVSEIGGECRVAMSRTGGDRLAMSVRLRAPAHSAATEFGAAALGQSVSPARTPLLHATGFTVNRARSKHAR